MNTGVVNGAITIRADVSDGHVRAVRVMSSRPLAPTALFVGRDAAEAPVLAGRLFSLCGYSHKVASALAVAAAKGEAVDPAKLGTGLLAERIGDYFRSLVIGWPDGGIGGLVPAKDVVGIRDALAACRELVAGSGAGMDRVRRAAHAVGALDGPLLLDRALAALPDDRTLLSGKPDALSADDDHDVVMSMAEHGEEFASAPFLMGRSAETGAYARRFAQTTSGSFALAARMEARLLDLAAAVRDLDAPAADLSVSGSLWSGQGYGVVESPRGRLYHWVKLDKDGMVADYAIVAPTEWNFHPTGPFVSSLLGAKVGGGDQAQRLVSWLAALFDPCVAFRVTVAEEEYA